MFFYVFDQLELINGPKIAFWAEPYLLEQVDCVLTVLSISFMLFHSKIGTHQ